MPEQLFEARVEVPEGWQVVDFRPPKFGEFYLGHGLEVIQCSAGDYLFRKFVLRRLFQWPKWLKANFIAMDASGDWFGFSIAPTPSEEYGTWRTDCTDSAHPINLGLTTFVPPEGITDWQKSLHRRPNATP